MKGAELESLSVTEVGMMLRDSAWREVQWKWEVGTWDNSPSVQSHDTFEYRYIVYMLYIMGWAHSARIPGGRGDSPHPRSVQ